MGRYYHLSKKASVEEADAILKGMRELNDVESVEITQDGFYMKVVTKDGRFEDVMGSAVNICSRAAGGMELSFTKFSYDE